MRQEKPRQPEILHGWKEIASYLRKGVRSVQRYERELRLPIHRIAGRPRSAVLATKGELDDWVCATPLRRDEGPKRVPEAQTNRLGVDFLQVDSEIALTFSSMALGTSDREKRIRATRTARRAYDAITRLRKKIEFNEAERDKLDANLQRLKDDLQRLGERL